MAIFSNHEYETILSSYCQYALITNMETDVTLITRSNRSVSAHKMVLSSVSDFLKTLCTEYETIMLPDVEYEVVSAFLSLLYTGQTEFNGPCELLEFVDLTNMLGVSLPDYVRKQICTMYDVCSAADGDCKPGIEVSPEEITTCIVDGRPLQSHLSDCQISQANLSRDESTVESGLETKANSLEVVSLLRRPEPRPESPWFSVFDDIKEEKVDVSSENGEDPLNVYSSCCEDAVSSEQRQTCDNLVEQNTSHPQAQDLECDFHHQQCIMSSKDSVSLGDSQMTHLRGSPWQSPQTQETLNDDNHLTGNLNRCPQLTKKSTNSNNTQRCVQLHSLAYRFPCSKCDKRFRWRTDLNTHLRNHKSEYPYHCSQCDKSFSIKGNLDRHLRVHSGERPYKCVQCDKSFNQKSTLDRHFNVHSGMHSYKCSQCDKTFSVKSKLDRHFKVHSGEHPYKCSQCEKSFPAKLKLDRHFRVHNVERPYKCSECDRSFNWQANLDRHSRVHSIDRPYKCSECDKSFSQQVALDIHFKVHSGERPYQCSQCSYRFNQRIHLTTHLRIHAGDRPYHCSQCDKRFTLRYELKGHLRVHTGERPYNCSQCDKTFTHRSLLNRHLRVHNRDHPDLGV